MIEVADVFFEIILNPIFISSVTAVVLSQILKIFYYYFKEKRINYKYLASSGGFPSSHAATVMAMSLSTGFQEGFSSTLFIMAVTISLIIMYDAAGVRQAAGDQAKILNKILDEVIPHKNFNNDESLKELIGHTPMEVLAGGIIGFLTALIVNLYF